MSLALWPSVLLSASACLLAGLRTYVLAWKAPLDAPQLAAAISRQLAQGQPERALALCRALTSGWAAECAAQLLLQAGQERGGVDFLVDDLRAAYRLRASSGVGALRALGRMAFPLALGSAIFVMSGAFGRAEVSGVEHALSTALQCLTVGVSSAVFCRVSAALLLRQGEARLREIALVCRGIVQSSWARTLGAAADT